MGDTSTRRRKPQKSQICRLVIKDPSHPSQDSPLNLCLKDSDVVPCCVADSYASLPQPNRLETDNASVVTSLPMAQDPGAYSNAKLKPTKNLRQRKPRSALFVPNSISPSNKLNNEVSIGKFKFVGGQAPSLTEKKMLHVDGRGNLKFSSCGTSLQNQGIGTTETAKSLMLSNASSCMFDSPTITAAKTKDTHDNVLDRIFASSSKHTTPPPRSQSLLHRPLVEPVSISDHSIWPRASVSGLTPGLAPAIKFINYKPCDKDSSNPLLLPESQLESSQYAISSPKPAKKLPKLIKLEPGNIVHFTTRNNTNLEPISSWAPSAPPQPELLPQPPQVAVTCHRKRKVGKMSHREQLESKFKEKGFLIKTEEVQANTGATFCKFRQLRKFTRYLYRSWKQYLPETPQQ
nr:EOG090X02D0 [Triops cancriformis]